MSTDAARSISSATPTRTDAENKDRARARGLTFIVPERYVPETVRELSDAGPDLAQKGIKTKCVLAARLTTALLDAGVPLLAPESVDRLKKLADDANRRKTNRAVAPAAIAAAAIGTATLALQDALFTPHPSPFEMLGFTATIVATTIAAWIGRAKRKSWDHHDMSSHGPPIPLDAMRTAALIHETISGFAPKHWFCIEEMCRSGRYPGDEPAEDSLLYVETGNTKFYFAVWGPQAPMPGEDATRRDGEPPEPGASKPEERDATTEFATLSHKDGLARARNLALHYRNLVDVLGRRLSPSEISHARYLDAAKAVHAGATENLTDVAIGLRNLRAIAPETPLPRFADVRRRAKDVPAELSAYPDRAALYRKERDRIADLLAETDEAETALDAAAAALAAVRTERPGQTDLDDAMRELSRLAERTPRLSAVQEPRR